MKDNNLFLFLAGVGLVALVLYKVVPGARVSAAIVGDTTAMGPEYLTYNNPVLGFTPIINRTMGNPTIGAVGQVAGVANVVPVKEPCGCGGGYNG